MLIGQPDAVARAETLRVCGTVLNQINHFEAPNAQTIARKLASEIRYPDSGSPLGIEALALELLAMAVEEAGGRPVTNARRLARRGRRLPPGARPRPSGCGCLTAISGVHPAHLARTFRRHHGMRAGVSTPVAAQLGHESTGYVRPVDCRDRPGGRFADQESFHPRVPAPRGRLPGRCRCSTH